MALPMGIEPISPESESGVLSQLNYGVIRWTSGAIEWRHSMPGIEPGPPRFSPRTVRPPYWWIIDQLRPIRNWGGQTDLHRYQRRHGAQCCCYTMTTIFKRGVGSSECRMPERYTNRFPAQPIPQSSFRTLHLNGAPGRTRTDEYGFTKPAL